jgi:amidase
VGAFNRADVDAGCAAAAVGGAVLLQDLGHHVEEAAPPALFEPELLAGARTLLAVHAAAELASWSAALGRELGEADVEEATWQAVEAGRRVTGREVLALLADQQAMSRRALAWWAGPDGFDLLVTPTTAEPGLPLGEYKGAGYTPGRASAFTRVFNATGQPALSLPLGWPDDGLPRGVQLVAGYGREDVLVRIGAQLESAAPWADRRPPVHA